MAPFYFIDASVEKGAPFFFGSTSKDEKLGLITFLLLRWITKVRNRPGSLVSPTTSSHCAKIQDLTLMVPQSMIAVKKKRVLLPRAFFGFVAARGLGKIVNDKTLHVALIHLFKPDPRVPHSPEMYCVPRTPQNLPHAREKESRNFILFLLSSELSMATRRNVPEVREANLSFEAMEGAIPKIDRRIADLDQLDVNSVNDRSDPRIKALEGKLDALLVDIFGPGTVEYNRYCNYRRLDTAGIYIGQRTPIHEVREGLRIGIGSAKAQLEAIKSGFLEALEDAGRTASSKTLKAYQGLELHPAIERAAGQLFKDGHYSNAIEDSVKALNALVRLHSGVDDKDGPALMEFVFSPQNPVLKFNKLADESDLNEQKGFMMMFSGAVAGLRNPRAHKIIKDDPEMALEFISFVSLLAKLADRSTK